jgi:transglutaminase-like putative cysteine protease
VRLVIKGNKLFFLRKSKPLRGRNLVGASSNGTGKRTVLKPDPDGGYDLSVLPHVNQVLSLCSHIPDTDYYAPYIRVPITVNARDSGFHNTPAYIYNMDKLKRIPTDKAHLNDWLMATDYFQSDEEPIKNLAEKIAGRCPEDNYLRVLAVHKFVARNLFYDHDELHAKERQDDSSVAVVKRRHTTCRGYVSLCVSLLRAMHIPAQQLPCYLAKPGQMIDIEHVKPKSHHVVVAAFADNRWLLLDPTRDSYNKYKKGEFCQSIEKPSLANFDMTVQFFSFTHWLP